jgi:hypothetical protein
VGTGTFIHGFRKDSNKKISHRKLVFLMQDTNLIFNLPLMMFTELNIIQVPNNNIADIDYPYEPGGLAVRTRWKKLMEN